jgi:O-methyltransferase involved in polyketide biosynthesis
LLAEGHRVVGVDALAAVGPLSLEAVAERELDASVPAVVLTEGLVDYFAPDVIAGVWQRVAGVLAAGAGGVYLSDLHLEEDRPRSVLSAVFLGALARATGGSPHLSFATSEQAAASLRAAGFDEAVLHQLSDYYDVLDIPRTALRPVTRVVEAWLGRPAG